MHQKPDESELPVVDIAPEGDVVFVVGDAQRRLRVHSLFLRTVSTVFNVMLGPRFSEGAGLSSENPKHIPLPEDDPDAMEIIFNLVHFRMDDVGDRFAPETVLNLAIATDKYDLSRALRLPIRDWLQCEGVEDPELLWKLARASYLLRSASAFETTSLGLLCHYGGPYDQLHGIEEAFLGVDGRFAAMMEERRARLRLEVVCRAAKSDLQLKSRRRTLGNKLDPIQISTTSLWNTIASLLGAGAEDEWGFATSVGIGDRTIRTTIEEFVARGLGGLCLTCVQTGEDHATHGA